ncbi:MAG: chemotaxis protein CheW [Clostridiales Family XIII bacterium]|jgi:chemotaxis protein histidine kinase CheA|nr:chemotaxis protein CheW [Clostridiales Family XIII bacterium]
MAEDFNNDSLLELYLYESTSLLDSLDNILLSAESDRILSSENINEIFRIMHTIKGSSAMMAYTVIAEVAHKTEDLFAVIREVGLADEYFDELFDSVLSSSDFLKKEIAKVEAGDTLETEVPAVTETLISLRGRIKAAFRGEDAPKADIGRTLGGIKAPATPEVRNPEPIHVKEPEPDIEKTMPVAPEGGRILGVEPTQDATVSISADISKVTSRVIEKSGGGSLSEPTTYYLHVHFNEGSKMENIRAFMLVNKLSEKGVVERSIPDNLENNSDAANQIIEHGLYVAFTTTMFREQIEALAKGTLSVETVSFVRRMPDETGTPTQQKAAVAPTISVATPATNANASAKTAESPSLPTPVVATPPQEKAPAVIPSQNSLLQRARPIPTFTQKPAGNGEGIIGSPNKEVPKQTAPANIGENTPAAPSTAVPATPTAPSIAVTDTARPQKAVSKVETVKTEAPQNAAQAPAAGIGGTKQSIISVDLKKLDSLLDLVGEIVINESLVTENPDLAGLELANFDKAARQLDKLTNELQDTVMSIRMLPVSMSFQRMRRIVRDMSKSLKKDAELVLVGENTEVDKTILDALTDPIMHLVRNAMDHALESPEERRAAGKNPVGHVILSAQNSGGDVIISVSDDGRGLDKNQILETARSKNLLRKPESEYSEKEIYNLLMAPGFSTREDVTEFSGRGVGMDVVKSNIEKIGGTVILESKKGQGTNVILKIPLTLAIISCMEISLGKDIYSIPISNIKESFKAQNGQLISDPLGNEMIMLRGVAYQVIRLYEEFHIDDATKSIDDGILVLVESGDKHACLLTDALIGKFQVVVKPTPKYLNRFGVKNSGISGCTIMGNGNISLIINVQGLIT